MFRNNLHTQEEISLLQARLRLSTEKLKQENENRFLSFLHNAELNSSLSNTNAKVLQDISNIQDKQYENQITRKLSRLAKKYVTKTKK